MTTPQLAYLTRLRSGLLSLRSRINTLTTAGQDVPIALTMRERAIEAMVGRCEG